MDVFDLFAKISLDTKEYDSGLTKAQSKLSGFGKLMGSAFGTVAKVGATALSAATAGIMAMGASSVSAGKDFDKSMSQVAATLGKTTDEINDLREFAQEMGRTTAFSATQAADALNYMALAGYDSEKSMSMLPNVLNLAAAGAMDLARASDMITDTQTAFGLSMERTTQMVSEMAKAASTGNTSVSQLGDAFLVVGGLAKELNGGMIELSDGSKATVDGLQEMEIALTAMANAGVKGSEAGTHMRNMLLKLASPTAEGTKALEKMGVQVFDAQGKMRSLSDIFGDLNGKLSSMNQKDKIQTISKLFNTRDMAAAEAMLAAIDSDWDKIGESILDAGISLDATKQAIEESGASLNGLDGKLEQLATDIRTDLTTAGMSVEDTAKKISETYGMSMEDAANAVGAVKGAIDQTTDAAEKMAATQLDNLAGDITLFKSALEGAQIAISDEITPSLRDFVKFGTDGLSKLTDSFKKGGLSGAVETFGSILSDGLVMIIDKTPEFIQAGMTLLKALGDGFAQNIDVIIGSIDEVVTMILDTLAKAVEGSEGDNAIVKFLSGLGNIFIKNLDKLIDIGAKLAVGLINGLIAAAPAISQKIVEVVSIIGGAFQKNAGSILDAGINLIKTLAQGIAEGLPQLLPQALDALVEFSAGLREGAGKLIDSGIELLMTLAQGLIDGIPKMVETIPTVISNIAGIINDNAPKLLEAGFQLIIALGKGLIEAIPTIARELPQIAKAIWDVFTALNWAALGKNIITMLSNGLKSLGAGLPNTIKSIGEDAIKAFKNIDWKNLGKNIVQFIVNGIKGLGSFLGNTLKEIGINAFNALKGIDWLGMIKALIDGLVTGVIQFGSGFIDAILGLGQSVIDAIKEFFGIHSPSTVFAEIGSFLIEGLIGGITNMIGDAVAAIGELGSAVIDGITGFFSDAWTQAKELASEAWGAIKDTATEAWGKIEEGAGKLRDNIGAFFDTAKTNAVNAWNDAKSKFSTVWSNVKGAFSNVESWFSTTFTAAKNKAAGAWSDIKSKFTTVWGDVKSAFSDAGEWFKTNFTEFKDKAVNAWSDIKDKFGKVWGNLKDAFNLDDALNWGKDLVSNFIGGIKAKAADLKEELKGVADKVKAFLGFSEPEEGPLSDFHTYAPDMMKLFAKGIKDNTDIVTDQIKKSFDFGNTISGGMTTGGVNMGAVTINVYARDGQSARDIVDELDYRLMKKTEAKKAVWGMS